MNPEAWLPVVGYEGLYEISDLGRVRSVDRVIENSYPGTTRLARGRILRVQPNIRSGHLGLNLYRDGKHHGVRVHRLVLEAFVGPCPDGMEGCHDDGHVENNALSNLRWDTRSENHKDRTRHGTHHNARKTHCPNGHPYDIVDEGRRRCSRCRSAQQRQARLNRGSAS